MKVVIPGGAGHVGSALGRHFLGGNHEVVILSRKPGLNTVTWDGETLGDWVQQIDGADVVINLAGRSVGCRYNAENLRQMMESRVRSTKVIGEAIASVKNPPSVWLQSSTATIYAHRFDAANDEFTGILGGDEPGFDPRWKASIDIAKAWERTLDEAETPKTRKLAIRSAMTMSADKGSVFDLLLTLTRRGLGGQLSSGRQYVSWIHEVDFCRAIDLLISREEFAGAVNLASPNPLPQREFAKVLRRAAGVKIGLPATSWMLEIATALMGTETELVLKSRRVIPGRLLQAGFVFQFPDWPEAARDLVARLGH